MLETCAPRNKIYIIEFQTLSPPRRREKWSLYTHADVFAKSSPDLEHLIKTMEWEIEKYSNPEYLVIKTKGEFSLIDFRLIWHDILNRDSWRPAMPILFDNRLIDLRHVGEKEVQEASKIFFKNRAEFAECPIAVVVAEGRPYGLSRIFQRIANRKTHASFEIFTERRKAENWLVGLPE